MHTGSRTADDLPDLVLTVLSDRRNLLGLQTSAGVLAWGSCSVTACNKSAK